MVTPLLPSTPLLISSFVSMVTLQGRLLPPPGPQQRRGCHGNCHTPSVVGLHPLSIYQLRTLQGSSSKCGLER